MAFTEKTFAQTTVGTTTATVMTASAKSVVKTIVVVNRHTTSTVRLKVYADADGSATNDENLIVNFLVPANDCTLITTYVVLEQNGTLSAVADTADALSITVCGAEV